MLLSPVDIEVVLLLKDNFLYPKTKEEFLEALKKLDSNDINKEKVLSKMHTVYRSIYDFYVNSSDDRVNTIINSIV